MQIYNDKGELIKRTRSEEKDLEFANSFETLFDKNIEPVTFAEKLDAGFDLMTELK